MCWSILLLCVLKEKKIIRTFLSDWVIVIEHQVRNVWAISWREQLTFWKDDVDDDVCFVLDQHIKWRWNRTMLNLCGIVVAILKMATGRNFSMSGINIYPHIKFWWYRTMLNFFGIVAAILKMATSRNCSMSGINSGHHYLPTYQILMILDNVEFLRCCGGHFENGDQ